ncbi:hypothetical protein N7462_000489 [Penicillium macrosclerotiorum]|uniref:uncharacterized protein n=1 Tax=Penicillium macrosclerotiorum TaxID=303699 RepID=UPI0025499776|nr:uncharacterized protein N7462_000489 [Penicillium macrosclerotiorum]KAJ5698484.1 hypothetical protein N7462_000489 [Penicillium macrosclerotiorum]
MSATDSVDGMVGAYTGNNYVKALTFTTFLGIALYNSVELAILVFATFQCYRGLYFWSLLLSALLGVVPQAVSFILKYFMLAPLALSLTISTIGWYFMVTGQAIVLYSRLNLLINDPVILRRVLIMIITNAVILHVPTTVITYGSNFVGSPGWSTAYPIMERIELMGFSIQEAIISGLYVLQTVRNLRLIPPGSRMHRSHRAVLYQVIASNLLMVLLDVILLAMEYTNEFVYQTTFKSVVYSIKLKLELAMLNRLVTLVRPVQFFPEFEGQMNRCSNIPHELTDFSGFTRVVSSDTETR